MLKLLLNKKYTMRSKLFTYFLVIVITALLIILGLSAYYRKQAATFISHVQSMITIESGVMVNISTLADDGQSDAVGVPLIPDCSADNRAQYDMLLGSLATLSTTQLHQLQTVFIACGNVDATRRAVMIARLAREFQIYTSYVDLYDLTPSVGGVHTTYPVTQWAQIIALEQQQVIAMQKLVTIQSAIIDARLKNLALTSSVIKDLVNQAQATKQEFITTTGQINQMRQGILNL